MVENGMARRAYVNRENCVVIPFTVIDPARNARRFRTICDNHLVCAGATDCRGGSRSWRSISMFPRTLKIGIPGGRTHILDGPVFGGWVTSAPSHHFHAMPPRIIRNSDRPRASNRTMITTQTALALAKFLRLDWHRRHSRENQTKGKPSRAKSLSESGDARTDSGLDIETQVLSFSGRGRSFFLTSLLIELIEGSIVKSPVSSLRFCKSSSTNSKEKR